MEDEKLFNSDKEENDYKADREKEEWLWKEKNDPHEKYEKVDFNKFFREMQDKYNIPKTPITDEERRVLRTLEKKRDAAKKKKNSYKITKMTSPEQFDIFWRAISDYTNAKWEFNEFLDILRNRGRKI